MAYRFFIQVLTPLVVLVILIVLSREAFGQKRVYATVDPNQDETADQIKFDINLDYTDNISSNVVFSKDGKQGLVAYTGSGVVVVFSVETGEVQARIETGGRPFFSAWLSDDRRLAVSSALDNRIFLIDTVSYSVVNTIVVEDAEFGFGSNIEIAPEEPLAYIASTGTGHLIKVDVDEGQEIDRVGGMLAPAQVTLTHDGSTAIVVDTKSETVEFIDTSSMSLRNTLRHPDSSKFINFTAFNRAVLDPSCERGIVASRDLNNLLSYDTVIYFDAGTGEFLDELQAGFEPGFTTLTPDGKYWMILNEYSITVVPTADIKAARSLETGLNENLFSSNIAFSEDSRFVFYPSSTSDQVSQQDIENGAIVGRALVGDNPDSYIDQPVHIAVAPGGEIAVVNFVSNKVDLLTDAFWIHGTKFFSSEDRFTGLSLVNTADKDNKVTIFAVTNSGDILTEEDSDIVNPVKITLPPDNQISKTASELFNFDGIEEREGWIAVFSELPGIVGYYSVGDTNLSKLDGAPLFREVLHEWIVPEVFRLPEKDVELNLVNSYFNTQYHNETMYDVYGEWDGEHLDTQKFLQYRFATSYRNTWILPEERLDGYLRMNVEGGLLFTEFLEFENAIGGINGIEIASFDGVKKIYSPQFAVMPGFKTILNLINASDVGEEEEDTDAEITITLHRPDGEIVGQPFKTALAQNAQLKDDLAEIFKDDPAVENVSGWLEVESSRDRILGTITFTNENEDFLGIFKLSGSPSSEFLFPIVAKDSTYNTGMAFLNNNSGTAEITVEVWGNGGTLDQSTSITLAPGTRIAIYISELFPNMPSTLQGNIRISSDQPLYSFSLLNDADFNFILALEPIAYP